MPEWPLEVENEEIIVRGLCSPYHWSVSKNKLKPEAFEPTPGTDEVSVMRYVILNANGCKEKAKAIADPSENKIYQGVACLRASAIRSAGVDVVDSRIEYLGHADIKLGISRPTNGDPPSPQDVKRLRQIGKDLLKITKTYLDPNPASETWSGESMLPPN